MRATGEGDARRGRRGGHRVVRVDRSDVNANNDILDALPNGGNPLFLDESGQTMSDDLIQVG